MVLAQVPDTFVLETPEVAWSGLVPLVILAAGGLLLLTITSLVPRGLPAWFSTVYTCAVGLAALVATIPLWNRVTDGDRGPFSTLAGAYGVDGFSVFLTALLAATVILGALVAHDFVGREGIVGHEYLVLLMLSATGGVIMASANDLIVMFLGLEILSLAVYVLAAIHARRVQSQEAGLKYFVLGALSSAFFLYGIALLYGATGSTNMIHMRDFLAEGGLTDNGLLMGGLALLLVGLAFKVAAVPFHAWAPDVYEGSPSPVVAYMASGVKVAGFAALLRIFYVTFEGQTADWQPIVYALAVATLVVGALFAIVQTNVKRMLAYSSISHAGFILVGVQAATAEGTASALFYLAAYAFLVIGSFAVITVVAADSGDAAHSLDDFRGLATRRPVLAFVFTVLLLGQAGVPLTTGFFAKFYVIGAAVDARSYWLAIIAMASAVVAAYLYLRIVVSMYLQDAPEGAGPIRVPLGAGIALFVAVGFTLVFGILPQPITELARDAIPVLTAAGG